MPSEEHLMKEFIAKLGLEDEPANSAPEAPEETQEIEVQAETQPTAEVAEVPEEEPEPEAVQPESEVTQQELPRDISGLAEAIGADPAYLYSIEVPLSDTGERIRLGELKDKLQNAERENRELKAKPPAETPQQINLSQSAQQLQMAQQADAKLEQDWAEFQQHDEWKKVVDSEPARAVQVMMQYQQEKARIQSAIAQAKQAVAGDRDKLMRETLSQIPTWKDADVMATERQGLRDWLEAEGVAPQRIDAETDSKLIGLLHRVWKGQTKQPPPSPVGLKPLKPTAPAPAASTESAAKRIGRVKARLAKAHTPEEKARAYRDLFG